MPKKPHWKSRSRKATPPPPTFDEILAERDQNRHRTVARFGYDLCRCIELLNPTTLARVKEKG